MLLKLRALIIPVISLTVAGLLLVVPAVFAQRDIDKDGRKGLNHYDEVLNEETGLGGGETTEEDCLLPEYTCGPRLGPGGGPVGLVASIINILLGVLGMFSVIMLIYGGYIWMLSRGNQDEAKRDREIIQGTIIGMALILTSYGIMTFVFNTLVNVAEGNR